jgi:aminoglycoside 3-N-acetyltransferase I
MNPVVRRFRSEDIESAGKVLLRFAERQPTTDQLRKFLALDANLFLVASIDGAWVGFAYAYELSRPDGSSMLFLYSIDVASEYRRRGVATAMLSHLRDVVDEHGMKELFVLANRSNDAAVAFYRATGGIVEHGEDLCFVYPSRKRPS